MQESSLFLTFFHDVPTLKAIEILMFFSAPTALAGVWHRETCRSFS
jgi:hypothetical protein